VRVSIQSVSGVASVEVSLENGLASVKLKPGNTVTLKQLQEAITKNGFTMKQSKVVAAGRLIHEGSGSKLLISGSNEVFTLIPESTNTAPIRNTDNTVVVEGTISEVPKGKTPDSIRYRSLTPEK
jgi:copper chaperone CopZ